MARKLYIFVPTGKVKTDGQLPAKWVGGFTTGYAYLGDYQARLLGMGNNFASKKLPTWLQTPAMGGKFLKGGASRYDRDFRGWG